MKTTLLSLVILLSIHVSFAQWTTSGNNIYNSNTGNVGIGTTAPSGKLEVNAGTLPGTVGSTLAMALFGGASNNYSQIKFFLDRFSAGTGWTTASTRIQAVTDVVPQAYIEFNPSGGAYGMALGTDGPASGAPNEIMRLLNNGSVGIGTTNPGSNKLAVEGTIGARKVVVTATSPFPDYVFAPAYALPSLRKVAEYIRKNGRLPGMPSADSVNRSGLDLGNTQVKLVEKVEELTLYTIALQDKADALQNEVDALKAENKKLLDMQQQIDALKQQIKSN